MSKTRMTGWVWVWAPTINSSPKVARDSEENAVKFSKPLPWSLIKKLSWHVSEFVWNGRTQQIYFHFSIGLNFIVSFILCIQWKSGFATFNITIYVLFVPRNVGLPWSPLHLKKILNRSEFQPLAWNLWWTRTEPLRNIHIIALWMHASCDGHKENK